MVAISASSLGAKYEKFGLKTIKKTSPEAERRYLHELLIDNNAEDGFLESHLENAGRKGIIDKVTNTATANKQYELGITPTGTADPVTIFGLELARNNGRANG